MRAYEAGSDHHLAHDSTYLVVRAVIGAVAQRALGSVTSRHLHVGELHIDTAARIVDIQGRGVELGRKEFDLLRQLASHPTKVFAKDELMRAIWGLPRPGRTRTLDGHVISTPLLGVGCGGCGAVRVGSPRCISNVGQ